MPRMTAARAAVEILRREGITQLFGLPGAAINPFYRAVRDQGEIVRQYTKADHRMEHQDNPGLMVSRLLQMAVSAVDVIFVAEPVKDPTDDIDVWSSFASDSAAASGAEVSDLPKDPTGELLWHDDDLTVDAPAVGDAPSSLTTGRTRAVAAAAGVSGGAIPSWSAQPTVQTSTACSG